MGMKAATFALAFICVAGGAFAHPHQFIDYSMTIYLDEFGLASIRQEWSFLREHAMFLVRSFDKDGDSTFSEEEEAALYDSAFHPMVLNNYHFHLRHMGREYVTTATENFSASIGLDEVNIGFSIPCVVPAGETGTTIEIAVYDDTAYTSFDLRFFSIRSPGVVECEPEYLLDENVFSHGVDRYGLRVRLKLGPARDSGSSASPPWTATIVPRDPSTALYGPTGGFNPFTGASSP